MKKKITCPKCDSSVTTYKVPSSGELEHICNTCRYQFQIKNGEVISVD